MVKTVENTGLISVLNAYITCSQGGSADEKY